ncbi:MAG: hypothetical protein GY858_02260 [Candidatus Omnitrophica bacterium]|nr:hypothetical protein [Candidatus Omnitrophota bacterium]
MKNVLRTFLILFVVLAIGVTAAFAAKCSGCGAKNKDSYKFCVKCGGPLNAEAVLQKNKVDRATSGKLGGVKKTIGVIGFENASGMGSYVSLGNDFGTQLTDALVQSGNFIVLTRSELSSVFGEQDLVDSGRMAKSLTAQKGKAIPAQILIKGKITEFEENAGGGNQGLTIKGITLGANKSNAHIGVILQIMDSTTGQVLDSKRIEGKANASGFSLGYSGGFSLGSSSFKKTPLGKATQIAIDRAVIYIADKLERMPWQGKVVSVKEGVIFINAGSNAGIESGSVFVVYRQGEALIDPDTGMELGADKKKIADISITEVQDKFSKAKTSASSVEILRGDLILEN